MFVELAVASSIHFFIPFGHRAIYSPSFIGGEISEWGKEGLFGSQKAFTDIGTNKQLPNETNRFNWPPLSLPSLYSFPSPLFDTADFFLLISRCSWIRNQIWITQVSCSIFPFSLLKKKLVAVLTRPYYLIFSSLPYTLYFGHCREHDYLVR